MNERPHPPPLPGTGGGVQQPPPGAFPPADDRPPWFNLLHPWSGGWLLFVDNVCFGANALTGFLATPIVIFIAFGTVFAGVYRIQRKRAGNGRLASFFKAFMCGVLAGVPWSIAGTAVGGLVLLAAGMSSGASRK